MEGTDRRLMWHGMCLFILGLITGFVEERFANVRMGLAAHASGRRDERHVWVRSGPR